MSETWKQIEGFSNYEVSDHGRIRNKTTNKMLKPYDSGGRMSVTLCVNCKGHGKRLHNLVAAAFIPNPDQRNTCIMQIWTSGIAGRIICFGFRRWIVINWCTITSIEKQCCKS